MSRAVAISGESVPRLPPGVKLQFNKQHDKWIIQAPERVFELDQIALEIVKRCDGEASVATIVDDLARAFSADRAVIENDVIGLLQGLADKGVLSA